MGNVAIEINEGAIHALLQEMGAVIVVAAALQVVNHAKELCPVDTGRLRGSIAYEIGAVNGLPSARIGSNVEYAVYVELGTRHMSARPFLRPALASVKGLVV